MNPALMLVALVLAREGPAAVTIVRTAPEEFGLQVDVVLVTLEISEPLEGRVAAAVLEAEVLVVAHLPCRCGERSIGSGIRNISYGLCGPDSARLTPEF